MAGEDKGKHWEGLSPDVLASIFKKIPADELMRIVPLVCRRWREALERLDCWSEINIMKWSRLASHSDVVDVAVRNLVHLSCHNLRRLSACQIGNSAFSLAASSGNHLRVLEIPMSKVDDSTLERSSGSLKALAILDISYCTKITSKGIEILGKNCKSLIHLRRNLNIPFEYESMFDHGIVNKFNEDEALAVANTMLGLEQLELKFGRFTDCGLDAILNNCKSLSSLNIAGCMYVELVGKVGIRCHALKSFKDPFHPTYEWHSSSSDEYID